MPTFSRRAALVSIGSGITLAAFGIAGCPSNSNLKLKFILNWKYQGPQGWFFQAQDRGYFAQEKLDIIFDQGDGSAAAVPKIASGAYDLGFGDINALIRLASVSGNDAPIGVFMLYNNSPFTIAVKAESTIVRPRDLEGKTIGGPADDAAMQLFPVFCAAAHIDRSKVKILTVQPSLREQMLLAGQVDGIFGYFTTIRFGVKQLGANADTEIRWIKYGDYGLDLYSNAIIASRRLMKEHPDELSGFLRALNRGIRDALEDPAAAVEAVRKREPLINVPLELERFRATLDEMDNPEIQDIGLGDVKDERLARSIKTVSEAWHQKPTGGSAGVCPVFSTSASRSYLFVAMRSDVLPPQNTETPYVQLKNVDLTLRRPNSREPPTQILKSMSLEVNRGHFVALIGPSGSGKTTVLKLIAGIMRPTGGSVLLNEADPTLLPIGLATQAPSLFPWLDVLDNVMLPFRIAAPFRDRFRLEQNREFRERALHLLEQVDLGAAANKYPWELSIGMAQRVSLCRALVTEPKLLLLDEPFAPLDQITRENLWDTLQMLLRERAATTSILVSHDLRESTYLADKVCIMRTKPGAIQHEIELPYRRPRQLDITYTDDFLSKVRLARTYLEQANNSRSTA